MGLFRLIFRFNRRVFGDLKPYLLKNITMKIYEDVFSNDEMFSDTYPIKLVNDCMWEITGKHISRTQDDVKLEGANASAEEFDEGTDAASESGIDIVLNHRLCETGFGSKKDYTTYLKDYMKKVVKYLEENDMKDEVDGFKTNISGVMKELLGKFKDLQFFTGESMDAEAMILMLEYRDVNGEERPIVMGFKHGLREVKC